MVKGGERVVKGGERVVKGGERVVMKIAFSF